MIYDFMDDEGNILEAHYPMTKAPKIGSVHTIRKGDGTMVKATRIISVPSTIQDNWKPYASDRLPRNLAGCRCTPAGKPIIETRQQEREVAARLGFERE